MGGCNSCNSNKQESKKDNNEPIEVKVDLKEKKKEVQKNTNNINNNINTNPLENEREIDDKKNTIEILNTYIPSDRKKFEELNNVKSSRKNLNSGK